MIIKTRTISLSIATLLMLGLSACATTSPSTQELPVAPQQVDASYVVQPGNRLTGISLKFTGRADYWPLIAQRNGIVNPRSLAVGQTIYIPYELLSDTNINEPTAINVGEQTIQSSTRIPIATSNGLSVARASAMSTEDTAAISVMPVEVNRSFSLQPIEHLSSYVTNTTSNLYHGPKIRVAGTYYPKGLYAEPANYARLLSRVNPGTEFLLEGKVNDWYKVVTDEGVGYLRRSDAVFVK